MVDSNSNSNKIILKLKKTRKKMKQFVRIQNTEGNEVIINTDYIIKITAQPKTYSTYERTMIELNVEGGVNIFTYLNTDAIYDKLN